MYRIGLFAVAFLCKFSMFAVAQETPPPPPITKRVAPTYQEIASPMQIEVSLGATPKRNRSLPSRASKARQHPSARA